MMIETNIKEAALKEMSKKKQSSQADFSISRTHQRMHRSDLDQSWRSCVYPPSNPSEI